MWVRTPKSGQIWVGNARKWSNLQKVGQPTAGIMLKLFEFCQKFSILLALIWVKILGHRLTLLSESGHFWHFSTAVHN